MPTLFDGHYLRNRSTLVIGVLDYIGIVRHKEHSPEDLSIPPGTLCIWVGSESSVSIATCHGLDGPGIESWWRRDFSAPVQPDPGAHPTSYKTGTGFFLWGKAAGAWL